MYVIMEDAWDKFLYWTLCVLYALGFVISTIWFGNLILDTVSEYYKSTKHGITWIVIILMFVIAFAILTYILLNHYDILSFSKQKNEEKEASVKMLRNCISNIHFDLERNLQNNIKEGNKAIKKEDTENLLDVLMKLSLFFQNVSEEDDYYTSYVQILFLYETEIRTLKNISSKKFVLTRLLADKKSLDAFIKKFQTLDSDLHKLRNVSTELKFKELTKFII